MRAGDDSVQPCSKSFFFFFFTALSCLVLYTKGDIVVDWRMIDFISGLFKVHLEPKHSSLSLPHHVLLIRLNCYFCSYSQPDIVVIFADFLLGRDLFFSPNQSVKTVIIYHLGTDLNHTALGFMSTTIYFGHKS